MKADEFLQALGHLDDQYIQQAAEYHGKRRKLSRMIGTVAAACLVVFVSAAGIRLLPQGQSSSSLSVSQMYDHKEDRVPDISQQTDSTGSVTIPPADVYLGNDASAQASMAAFFIYQGRCYVQYETLDEDYDLIGEHLGTAKGLIDEWTPADGYVDLAGSIGGDFYAVNGYDPDFMLCMKSTSGLLRLFICNNGITLQYGAELYEDWLHLSENYAAVEFETRKSWYNSEHQRYRLTEDSSETIETFIHQLDTAEFIPTNQISLVDGVSSVYEMEIYHLYFQLKDGLTVHLRLYQNGYVRFDGIMDVAVKIPETEWMALLDILENKTDAQKVEVADPADVQLENCLADPELGGFIPQWIPEEMQLNYAAVYYQLDSETGKETGTRQIMMDYTSPDNTGQTVSIIICRADETGEFAWLGPVYQGELSVDMITKYLPDFPEQDSFELGVQFGDVIVGLWGWNIDAETILKIFESVSVKNS